MLGVFQVLSKPDMKVAVTVGLLAAGLAGCGSAESVAGKVISGGREPIEVSPETFAPPVPCPPMELKTNTYLIRKFERGKEDQQDGLLYQATIEDWANTCSREGVSDRRIKLGLSGDVTPGPAWKGGEVVLPIRVAIMEGGRDGTPSVTELLQVPVTIGAGSPSETWTLVENKFVIPQAQSSKIIFGFDEGRRR
ncbi:hypothetical protein E1180_19725 [Roseibium denhamense]|uniref:Lipoprotein n=1 Tax=Roseibium denhamense TaxID=76305 RepID=A0ABY1P2M6_9HYPH|nr:hypothetical protein [Roseibium denhamense]MTI07737.1 hypothetical protein [Roseibium denhamense]SMP25007.1 hypothetical protein SAMN06265374_2506 [Roseibium denhamense]